MFKKGKNKARAPKSRKQLRKEERKNKKLRRHEYYTNRRQPGRYVLINNKNTTNEDHENPFIIEPSPKKEKSNKFENKLESEKIRDKERKQQKKLQNEMNNQRKKQLIEANLEEDRTIKQLEKQLKLNKRKSKAVPASFSVDGLDYLLEVCDSDTVKSSVLAEQQLMEVNDEFEEDLALMTEKTPSDDSDDSLLNFGSDDDNDGDSASEGENTVKNAKRRINKSDGSDCKRRRKGSENSASSDGDLEDDVTELNEESQSDADVENAQKSTKQSDDGTWEDIYGRLRAADGSVISGNNQKYVPPGARVDLENSSDKIRNQKLDRLKRQLKGFLNRLAESNMHNIANQMEELYMNNSRNDMNNTITNLIIEALATNILAPERLLMEHILLVTILHANIGTEVGAHFLQTIVKLFDEQLRNGNAESKKLDNLVIILAQLYNFKLFDSKLIFDVLNTLIDNFEEKDVECILHILRNVGFNLRKDDPVAMKNLILTLQKKASTVSDRLKNNPRVKFMLDVLLAIKNNNVSKIPNYDTSYSEHLKKIMKGFIRKGNYVSQLNISMEDLLKVDEKGKWWVVGSAWAGNSIESNENSVKESSCNFSQNLLELAKKQRMNTDTRKNIFCIIMSSEDYLDAFEKLLRLSLKNQQEREIIHVLLHCCLQEKKYNPFYAVLAQKFCEHDRKYQMTIKYSIWDKLKSFKEHSASQISNLAKLLSFLFMEKGLPISILKVVQFSDLDKVSLRFMRQILLKILLHEDLEMCKGVFEKVCQSDKLKIFRESLRLFMHHFLLKNLQSQEIPDDKRKLLQERVKIVEKLLTGKEIRS